MPFFSLPQSISQKKGDTSALLLMIILPFLHFEHNIKI